MKQNFPLTKFVNICDFARGPFGGTLKKNIFVSKGYAVYEQTHAIQNRFDQIRYFVDKKKYLEMKYFHLKPGDLIISCSGTMGKVAIAPNGIQQGVINQALLKLTPKKEILSEYVKVLVESNFFQLKVSEFARGAAIDNMVKVKILKEVMVPAPTLDIQKKIVKKIKKIQLETDTLKKMNEIQSNLISEFGNSLMGQAFTGNIKLD
jgi:hypothetical protein